MSFKCSRCDIFSEIKTRLLCLDFKLLKNGRSGRGTERKKTATETDGDVKT